MHSVFCTMSSEDQFLANGLGVQLGGVGSSDTIIQRLYSIRRIQSHPQLMANEVANEGEKDGDGQDCEGDDDTGCIMHNYYYDD